MNNDTISYKSGNKTINITYEYTDINNPEQVEKVFREIIIYYIKKQKLLE